MDFIDFYNLFQSYESFNKNYGEVFNAMFFEGEEFDKLPREELEGIRAFIKYEIRGRFLADEEFMEFFSALEEFLGPEKEASVKKEQEGKMAKKTKGFYSRVPQEKQDRIMESDPEELSNREQRWRMLAHKLTDLEERMSELRDAISIARDEDRVEAADEMDDNYSELRDEYDEVQDELRTQDDFVLYTEEAPTEVDIDTEGQKATSDLPEEGAVMEVVEPIPYWSSVEKGDDVPGEIEPGLRAQVINVKDGWVFSRFVDGSEHYAPWSVLKEQVKIV